MVVEVVDYEPDPVIVVRYKVPSARRARHLAPPWWAGDCIRNHRRGNMVPMATKDEPRQVPTPGEQDPARTDPERQGQGQPDTGPSTNDAADAELARRQGMTPAGKPRK